MSRLKITFYTIYTIICFLLQTTFSEAVTIFDVKINLLLVLVICISITDGHVVGGVFAVIVGLIADLTGVGFPLFNTILFTLLAVGSGFLRKTYFIKSNYIALYITFIASLIYGFLFYFLCIRLNFDSAIFYSIVRRILPECLFNAAAALIINPCLKVLSPKITSPIGSEY